ncbi:hypothetical protein FGM00_17820 [Aggregatimonas sangjinii]|uniref:Lipoprotein n=1 Tax=Aggregatimonas sangjinii TaxID=2583587 RepID=A0A5B7SY95_9FLAO|nr:hypothetical protein [Aggregatimonas sangjinii]QCX01881.1 hypothetical protein FGM00_17820 [Aggregatimonas sangjinii]
MQRLLPLLLLIFLVQSCIPIRIAPSIEDYKVTRGKKFKRSLSKRQMFIFENPKDEHHFYDYVNTKYQLGHTNVYDDVPFEVDGTQYFFAWYEIEIQDKALNLGPSLFNAFMNELLDSDDDSYISGPDVILNGNWYIAVEVYSDTEKDCLQDSSLSKEQVLNYLRALKKEYLSTHNYNEVVFKN